MKDIIILKKVKKKRAINEYFRYNCTNKNILNIRFY